MTERIIAIFHRPFLLVCILMKSAFCAALRGWFQFDKLIPVSGKGVVVGTPADESLSDVKFKKDELIERIEYL